MLIIHSRTKTTNATISALQNHRPAHIACVLTNVCLSCCTAAVGAPCSGDVVAFKAVVAGDTTAASIRNTNNNKNAVGKGLSSGSYTFWKEVATTLGATRELVNNVGSVQACLNACDNDFDCAAVAMTGTPNDMKAAPTTCAMIKGDKTIAAFKRSMTKAVATRLELGVAFA